MNVRTHIFNRFIIFTYFVGVSTPVFAKSFCADFLADASASEISHTQIFLSYLGQLVDNHIVSEQDLTKFIDALEKGEIINPISNQKASADSVARIHHQQVQEYINNTGLNQKRLLQWSIDSLKQKSLARTGRETAQSKTRPAHARAQFFKVNPGSFQMGEDPAKVNVTLTHSFEMMSTAVTQGMWVEEMQENPAEIQRGQPFVVINSRGKSIKVQPDHPVQKITWWSAVEYANRLSVKVGLKPAYDLSAVQFEEDSSAEAGDLRAKFGEQNNIKINAPDEDIYQAEGFRLPTNAEMEYMQRGGGKANGKYHFGDDESALKDYAWYSINSGHLVHQVAELLPIIVEGNAFYDLIGNVWEWNHDLYDKNFHGGVNPQGAVNPKGSKGNAFRISRGGGSSNSVKELCSHTYSAHDPNSRGSGLGFRLVRTVK